LGLTHVTVSVNTLDKKGNPFQDNFLVDTGSIDCMAPGDRLQAAGVLREGKQTYELANGQIVEFEFGYARLSFMGEERVSQIIFGPSGAEPIVGVVALESRGLIVDPVTRTLKRLHAISLKGIWATMNGSSSTPK
jgi:predicted aspartyl protease